LTIKTKKKQRELKEINFENIEIKTCQKNVNYYHNIENILKVINTITKNEDNERIE